MSGALDGLVVADFTRVLAGPYATMLLGDLGARVIKVERPGGGDDTRSWGPPFDAEGRATYFEAVNRNKSAVGIDLGTSAGREAALDLIGQADVFVNNFPPNVLAKFGLTYPELAARFPRLIHCSITGFGSGPGAALPGYDLLAQAVGGLMSITGQDEPTKVGVALVDVMTGLHATVGILAAVREREVSGHGQAIEVNLLSSLLSALVNQASGYVSGGVVPQAMGNAHPSISPYETYRTADRSLVLAVGNDGQFAKLCQVLQLDALATDVRFATNSARVANRNALKELLEERLSASGADHWWAELTQAGVPCGPINSVAEAFALAENLGLTPIIEMAPGRKQVANPISLSRTPVEYRNVPPEVPK